MVGVSSALFSGIDAAAAHADFLERSSSVEYPDGVYLNENRSRKLTP